MKQVKIPVKISTPLFSKPFVFKHFRLEARVGIEPTNAAFAEPCLTTWLPRLPLARILIRSARMAQVQVFAARVLIPNTRVRSDVSTIRLAQEFRRE